MPELEMWEWILLACGAFVAVNTLVRLMHRRRDVILHDVQHQAELESRRQKLAQQAEQRRTQRGEKAA